MSAALSKPVRIWTSQNATRRGQPEKGVSRGQKRQKRHFRLNESMFVIVLSYSIAMIDLKIAHAEEDVVSTRR